MLRQNGRTSFQHSWMLDSKTLYRKKYYRFFLGSCGLYFVIFWKYADRKGGLKTRESHLAKVSRAATRPCESWYMGQALYFYTTSAPPIFVDWNLGLTYIQEEGSQAILASTIGPWCFVFRIDFWLYLIQQSLNSKMNMTPFKSNL